MIFVQFFSNWPIYQNFLFKTFYFWVEYNIIYTQQWFCLSFSSSNIISIFLDLLYYLECPGEKNLLNYDGQHTELVYFNRNVYDILP